MVFYAYSNGIYISVESGTEKAPIYTYASGHKINQPGGKHARKENKPRKNKIKQKNTTWVNREYQAERNLEVQK